MFRSASSSVTDIMCGNYNSDETDSCERLGRPKATKKVTKKYENPISLSIDLLESFKNANSGA